MADTPSAPPLVPLADAPGELEVRKESWRTNVHELVAAAGPVARLDHAAWSGKARAETADGVWRFSRVKGARRSRIEVTEGESGAEVGRMDKGTWKRGGSIELDGRTYELHVKGFWRATWRWERADEVVAELELPGSFGKRKGTARVPDAGRTDPWAALLLLLALHVSTAEATATTTSVVATT